jgi:hypothetical protein
MLGILVFVLTLNLAPADHHDRVLSTPHRNLPVLLIDRGAPAPRPHALIRS